MSILNLSSYNISSHPVFHRHICSIIQQYSSISFHNAMLLYSLNISTFKRSLFLSICSKSSSCEHYRNTRHSIRQFHLNRWTETSSTKHRLYMFEFTIDNSIDIFVCSHSIIKSDTQIIFTSYLCTYFRLVVQIVVDFSKWTSNGHPYCRVMSSMSNTVDVSIDKSISSNIIIDSRTRTTFALLCMWVVVVDLHYADARSVSWLTKSSR